jgi:hypothetical protein
MTGAARQARTRRRRRLGLRVYRVELDEVAAEQMLADTGFLSELGTDNPASVEAALRALLEMLASEDE